MTEEQLKVLEELNTLIQTSPESFNENQLKEVKELNLKAGIPTEVEEPQFEPYSPTISPEVIQPIDVQPDATDVEKILQRKDEEDAVGDVWTRGFKNMGTALGSSVNIIPNLIKNSDQIDIFENMPEDLKKNIKTDAEIEQYYKEKADDIVNYFSEIEAKPATGRFSRSPESILGYLDPKRWYMVAGENAPLMAGMVATTIANPVAGTILMGAVEGGQTKSEILDYEEQTGKRVPEHLRRSIPLIVGAINASLEKTGIDRILKGFPGLKSRVASVLLTSVTEGTTEAFQGLNQQIAQQLTQEEKEVFKDFNWSQLGQEFYAGMVLGAGSSSISEISGIPQSKADEKFKVSKIGIEIERARDTGDFENITLDIAERFAKQNPEAFENNSALQFISEVRTITRETLKAKGENPDKFFVGEGLEANTKEARVLGSTLEENGQVLINLYKGARPDTVIEEFYGNAYRNLSSEEKSIWEEYYAEKVRDGETLTKQELFEKEGTQYYFDESLYKNTVINKVFQRVKQFLNNIIGRSKIDPKIRKMWEDAGYAKVGEGTASKDESFQLSNQKLAKLDKTLLELTEEGKPARFWYERSGKALLDAVDGDVDKAKKLLSIIAITSPQMDVKSNFGQMIKANYKYVQGMEPEAGRFPKAMANRIKDVMEGKEFSGIKTSSFMRNLMAQIESSPDRPVTVDLWMMRAFGFDKDTPTELEYKQIEKAVQSIAEKIGWEPHQVQASIWTSTQARWNQIYKQETDKAISAGSLKKVGRAYKWRSKKSESNFRKKVFKLLKTKQIGQQAIADANFDYADAMDAYKGIISTETFPHPTTEVFKDVDFSKLKYEDLLEYDQDVRQLLVNENGKDKIAELVGLLQVGKFNAPGFYEQESVPSEHLEVLMSTSDVSINPETKTLLELYSSIYGIITKQQAVGVTKVFAPKSKKRANVVMIETKASPLFEEIYNAMLEKGYDTGAIPQNYGFNIVNFDPSVDNKQFHNDVKNILENIYENSSESINIELGQSDGLLVENNWKENPNGENYRQRISESEQQTDIEQFIDSTSDEISKINDRFRTKWESQESFQITAFHGSPYKFDQFDSSQIGSGEQNQAFGHGLYFSSKEDIAKNYIPFKDTPDDQVPEKDGSLYRVTLHKGKDPSEYDYMSWVDPFTVPYLSKLQKQWKEEFPDKPDFFNNPQLLTYRGEALYRALQNELGSAKAVSDFMLRAGIDGIRYPAQGGVGGRFGDSENFVVFDDKAVTVDEQESFQLDPLDEMTVGQRFERKLIDKLNRLKMVQESIPQLKEDEDAIQVAETLHGAVSSKIEEFTNKIVSGKNSLLIRAKKDGFSLDDLGEYLYAIHAEERNKAMQEKNPKLATGSGMAKDTYIDSPEIREIREKLNKTKSIKKKKEYLAQIKKLEKTGTEILGYEDILKKYRGTGIHKYALEFKREVINKALKIRLDNGLINKETYIELKNKFKNYVPLKGLKDGEAHTYVSGKGFNVTSSGIMRALGRETRAENPLVQAIVDYQSAIYISEQNKVGNAFLRMVQNNKSPMWKVSKRKFKPTYNKEGEVEFTATDLKNDEFQTYFKGQRYVIKINDKDLLRAMNNLNSVTQNGALKFLNKFNTYYRAINTTINPEFLITNFERDLQTALLNMTAEGKKNLKRNVLKDIKKAGGGIRSLIRKDGSHEWAQIYKEFKENGGKAGWLDFKSINEKMDEIKREIKKSQDGNSAFNSIAEFIEDYNEIVENAVRLSTYKNLVDSGISKKKSAHYAKDLTVNFNRKGEWSAGVNALWTFSNAGMQGTNRIWRALKGKNGKRVAMGITAFGFGMSLLNRYMDEDEWDQFTDYSKDSYFMILLPNKKSVSIKLPYGYSWFYAVGGSIEQAIFGDTSFGDLLKRTAKNAVDSFAPISGGSLGQFVSPTILDPLIQLNENKTFYGGKIMKDKDRYTRLKDYERGFAKTSPIAKSATKWAYDKNLVDVSPATLEHIYNSYTGGAGKFVSNALTTLIETGKGNIVNVDKMPVIRQFIKAKGEWTSYNKAKDMLYVAEDKILNKELFIKYLKQARENLDEVDGKVYRDMKKKFIKAQRKAKRKNR